MGGTQPASSHLPLVLSLHSQTAQQQQCCGIVAWRISSMRIVMMMTYSSSPMQGSLFIEEQEMHSFFSILFWLLRESAVTVDNIMD
jgi:hypothetical protein